MDLIFTFFSFIFCFFFNDTATTEIYTLSLHDALPIRPRSGRHREYRHRKLWSRSSADRKSTRLNSRHSSISYAVFCLKKKKKPKKSQNKKKKKKKKTKKKNNKKTS